MKLIPLATSFILVLVLTASMVFSVNSQQLTLLSNDEGSLEQCDELAVNFYNERVEDDTIETIWDITFIFAEQETCLVYVNDKWYDLFLEQ